MKTFKYLALTCVAMMVGVPCVAQESESEKKESVAKEVKDDSQKVFEVVEKMPEFPGGKQGMLNWLRENVCYPEEARKKKIEGRVIVTFVVNEKGRVVEPTIVRSVDPLLDKEVLRLIKQMPKWKPGEEKGEPVRVKFTLPVPFVLR